MTNFMKQWAIFLPSTLAYAVALAGAIQFFILAMLAGRPIVIPTIMILVVGAFWDGRHLLLAYLMRVLNDRNLNDDQ